MTASRASFDRCPNCASDELEYEFIIEKTPVSRCVDCSLVFLNPQPSEARSTERGAPLPEPAWGELLRRIVSYAPAELKRVLLVSSSPGGAVDAAKALGIDVVPLAGDLDAGLASLSSAEFDGCIVDGALEQARDPQALLHALRRVLKEGGTIVIAALSIASAGARRQHDRWPGFRSNNLFYFSVDTLQSVLLKARFTDPLSFPACGIAGRDDHLMIVARAGGAVRNNKLSIIVPVFNESRTVVQLIERVIGKEIDGLDIEIIIVESNSTDGSREAILPYRSHPRVKVLLEDRPRGKGHAVRRALGEVSGDFILFQDADLEYDIEDYDALIRPLRAYRCNFVLGSRHTGGGSAWKIRNFRDAPFIAQYFNLGHLFFQTLMNKLYKQSLTDAFTMYKVFKRECLFGLDFECDRFDFDHEIVIKFLRKGYQPVEIPVNYTSRSMKQGKKVTLIGDPITCLKAEFRFRKTPLYDHNP
jgi:SAM-dependent methyltransferase